MHSLISIINQNFVFLTELITCAVTFIVFRVKSNITLTLITSYLVDTMMSTTTIVIITLINILGKEIIKESYKRILLLTNTTTSIYLQNVSRKTGTCVSARNVNTTLTTTSIKCNITLIDIYNH